MAAQHGAAFLHMAVDELTGIDELAGQLSARADERLKSGRSVCRCVV